MRIDVLTVFPEMFGPVLAAGIVGKAIRNGIADVRVHDLRDFAHDRHRSTDDSPFGGGPGMVMLPGPLFEAVRSLEAGPDAAIIALTPQGRPFGQRTAERLAGLEHVVLICGRYEGVDERVIEELATEEISTGDYVVSGGEIPAMLIVDALVRLLPERWDTAKRRWPTTRTRQDCCSIRSTRAPPISRGLPCRRCCSPATTRRSRSGADRKRCGERSNDAPTCSPRPN